MRSNEYMGPAAIDSLIEKMVAALRSQPIIKLAADPVMIGIHTGGVWLAERLHSLLSIKEPLGVQDISFYRDDFTRIGMNPQVKPSNIPFAVDDRHIILIDDVLQTGRTIRAAMNEIFDYGRPASITLVTLVEREGRELPIQPDVVGIRPPVDIEQHITLNGPDPLSLIIGQSKARDRD